MALFGVLDGSLIKIYASSSLSVFSPTLILISDSLHPWLTTASLWKAFPLTLSTIVEFLSAWLEVPAPGVILDRDESKLQRSSTILNSNAVISQQ